LIVPDSAKNPALSEPLFTKTRSGISPREEFYGRTLEEALAWWLIWLMGPEIGVGPFRV
jgi:hypothetical protein